jgi:hypothetical protein
VTATLTVYNSVWAKFDAITGIYSYDAVVPNNPPVDGDGTSRAYAVLYMSPGLRYASALNGVQGALLDSFQVTCVGGRSDTLWFCVDKVRTGMPGPVTIDGKAYQIRIREEDPGPARRDDDKVPPRHWVPLEFQLMVP